MLNLFKQRNSSLATSSVVSLPCKCRKSFIVIFIFNFLILCVLPLISLILIKSSDFNGSIASIIGRLFFIIAYLTCIVTMCIVLNISQKRNDKYTSRERTESIVLPILDYINRLKVEQSNILIASFISILGLGKFILKPLFLESNCFFIIGLKEILFII
jgi:hypothetical protein